MSKAINIFIDTMISTTSSKYSKDELLETFTSGDKEAIQIGGGIVESMKVYALAFCQHQLSQVSHIEVTISDLNQWDKENG